MNYKNDLAIISTAFQNLKRNWFIDMMINEEWLKKTNLLLREQGIEPRRRPLEAIRMYAEQNKTSVSFSSPLARTIFDWFYDNTKPGSHNTGALYESVYFFDSSFWLIQIPLIYGRVELNPISSLKNIPDSLKNDLMNNPKSGWDYNFFWADCVDYGFGIDDLYKDKKLNRFGIQLLMAGDQELRAATALLIQDRPQQRALLTCRMATELFIKSYIALKDQLSERQARSIGHDLFKAFDRFIEASGLKEWIPLRDQLSVFPAVNERYSEHNCKLDKLWSGFSIAQSFGAITIRNFTDRNIMAQVLQQSKSRPL